jgi:hypothetical protein
MTSSKNLNRSLTILKNPLSWLINLTLSSPMINSYRKTVEFCKRLCQVQISLIMFKDTQFPDGLNHKFNGSKTYFQKHKRNNKTTSQPKIQFWMQNYLHSLNLKTYSKVTTKIVQKMRLSTRYWTSFQTTKKKTFKIRYFTYARPLNLNL